MKQVIEEQLSLLEALKMVAPDSSNNTRRSWIEKGRVCVNGQVATRGDQSIRAGEEVTVGPRVQFAREGIKILFEDQHLVVLEKPPGLLSVATDFQLHHTVHAILKQRHRASAVYPVHRLDKDTSGVMIFTYTAQAREHLKAQFWHRSILKEYEAIVEGVLPQKLGKWESFLEEDPLYFVASTSDPRKGKLSMTSYEVLAQNKTYAHLKLTLHTGRKNQLRVHCKEAGYPIVGDKKYGAVSNPVKRLCLHAKKIRFAHPVTEKMMTFESPLPQIFLDLV